LLWEDDIVFAKPKKIGFSSCRRGGQPTTTKSSNCKEEGECPKE
jgi:hypothetical protein